MKKQDKEETTYLILHENGKEKRITVPSNWKVTFGPAVKGNNAARTGLKMPMCLRFYEHDTRQRALFTDVVSFRDMSIKIEEKKESVQEKEGYMECEGVKKKTIFQARVYEWKNPDEETQQESLPSPEDIEGFEL